MRLPSLRALLPACAEERSLVGARASLCVTLPVVAAEYEILAVNDDSRDRTGAIADRPTDEDAHVRHRLHATNPDHGAAVVDGLEAGRDDPHFCLDLDHRFNVSPFALLVSSAAHFDAVIGYHVLRARQDCLATFAPSPGTLADGSCSAA